MADLTEIQAAGTTKIAGSDSTGLEDNFLEVDSSGRVTVNQGAAGAANWLTNIAAFGGTSVALGQTTMSASIPVTLASNQSALAVSGTVTANIGTTNGLALDATLTGGTQKTKLVDTGGTNVASISVSGALKVDGSAVTQPVSGTFWQTTQPISAASLPLPTGAATEATLAGVLTTSAFQARVNTLGQKTMANSTPVVLASDQTVIPVSQSGAWSVTANAGTNLNTSALALDATLTGGTQTTRITDGTNTATVKAASTAAAATDKALVVAISPNNTVAATQSSTWTVQPGNTANSTPWLVTVSTALPTGANTIGAVTQASGPWTQNLTQVGGSALALGQTTMASSIPVTLASNQSALPPFQDSTSGTVALGGINQQVTLAINGQLSVSMALASGTLIGTINASCSIDGGTNYNAASFQDPATGALATSIVFGSANSLTHKSILIPKGTTNVRVQVTAYTSGTANCVLRAVAAIGSIGLSQVTDGTSLVAVKAASTAAAATDPALVVAISPNNTIASTQSGTWTVAQGTAAALASAWPIKLTDGTNTMPTMDVAARAGFHKITDGTNTAAVKAASTSAVASDPALVVTLSPNNPVSIAAGDVTSSSNLNALNAAVTVTHPGQQSVGVQIAAGTLIGTVIGEISFDGGTTWVQSFLRTPNTDVKQASIVFASANPATAVDIIAVGGAGMSRLRVSAFTSGTASATARAASMFEFSPLYSGPPASTLPPSLVSIGANDGGTLRTATIKAASTAPAAADQALVVVLSPNQPAIPVTTTPATSTPNLSFGEVTLSSTGALSAVRKTTYTEQSVNFTGSVSSSSANDSSGGTGARTVKIFYVDSTGATAGTETVTMNGTTAVNLVTTTKCFIEKIEVVTVGSTGSNFGTITLFSAAAGGGTAIGTIAATDKRTFWCHHYVVTGKTCNVTGILHSNNSTVSGGTSIAYLTKQLIGSANQVEEQVSETLSVGGAMNPFFRSYGSQIQVTGPARVTMYTVAGSAASIIYRGSFDAYDA